MNKITKISVQKNNKNRVNVYINDEFSFACDMELVYRYNLSKDMEINLDYIKDILQEEEYISCRAYGLRVIERSYKTEYEITKKMRERKYSDDVINRVIDVFKKYNYIDDEKYAAMFVKDKLKTQGSTNIRQKLLLKGINEEIINEALSNIGEEEQYDTARMMALKKYNIISSRESDKRVVKQKLFRFLVSKGYNFSLVNKVIREILDIDTF